MGISLDGGQYRSDDSFNYLGTYTFESLETYDAGRPRTYTRRIGDPYISYWNLQSAVYVQDDIRVSKRLTLSPGVRVEFQTHVDDKVNIGPRFGATWAPFKSGKTTVRLSAGVFYDWLAANTYEQTLRVDGERQKELIVADPDFPVTGGGVIPPTNRYLLDPDLVMARNSRVSAGIEQQIGKAIRLGAVYSYVWGRNILVGQNLNAPVDGVRPDPAMANVIEAVSAGESRNDSIQATMNVNFSPPAMGGVTSGPWFAWRRGLISFCTYTVGRMRNNTDGPFAVPASGNLATEWGPASGNALQTLWFAIHSQAIKHLTATVAVWATSGLPYTIRTGLDDNGDLMFNDRPAGVGRNSVRGAGQRTTYANFSYVIGLGKRKVALPPGIMILPSGGGLNVGTMTGQEANRYRLTLSVMITNITNHHNYGGYSGVMTSPFFRQPTIVEGVRRFDFAASISF
jgi:hypothetical protein